MTTVETYDINRHNNLLKLQYSLLREVLSGKFCGSNTFAKRARTTLFFEILDVTDVRFARAI